MPHSTSVVTHFDPYYGHQELAKMSARLIIHHFHLSTPSCPPLDTFIALTLYRTQRPSAVAFTALYLLGLIEDRVANHAPAGTRPTTTGHRLFLAAYMVASKMLCDDNYSNASFADIARGVLTLHEINDAERELCRSLDFRFNVPADALADFTHAVRRDFRTVTMKLYSVPDPGAFGAAFVDTGGGMRGLDAAVVSSRFSFGVQYGMCTPRPAPPLDSRRVDVSVVRMDAAMSGGKKARRRAKSRGHGLGQGHGQGPSTLTALTQVRHHGCVVYMPPPPASLQDVMEMQQQERSGAVLGTAGTVAPGVVVVAGAPLTPTWMALAALRISQS